MNANKIKWGERPFSLYFYKKGAVPILLILAVLIYGCQYPFELRPESEIIQEVIEQDPSFKEALDKKSELDEKISALSEELNLKAVNVKSKIGSLKREFRDYKQDISSRIESVNSQLDPQRSSISQKITELSSELNLKQSSLSATNRMIADLKKLIQQRASPDADAEDVSRLQDRIDSQVHQAELLKQDIACLRDKIRLERLKLRLLR
jgi:chromosome segregation ATPase